MRHILTDSWMTGTIRTGRPGMAPALASASASTDSIKGLAQSIAKPAYRRLLIAEPALRRAVPVLIIAFLVTMAVGAIVTDIDAIADLVALRLDQATATTRNEAPRRAQELLDRALGARATEGGRQILISDLDGNIVASAPMRYAGRSLLDVLGPAQPLTTFAASAGVMETPLGDGSEAFATVRGLAAPLGQIAVIQPRDVALAPWR